MNSQDLVRRTRFVRAVQALRPSHFTVYHSIEKLGSLRIPSQLISNLEDCPLRVQP